MVGMPLITPWMLQEQFQVDWVKLVPLLMASPLKDWRMEQLLLTECFLTCSRYLVSNTQLPSRLISPSDKCKKLSRHFLLHSIIGMGSHDHYTKYQGLFSWLLEKNLD